VKVISIFGTRPEAIKMAPLVNALQNAIGIESIVCVTGQHQTMLQQVLDIFQIRADHDLALMVPNQTLNGLSSKIIASIDHVLEEVKPDQVLVHGDTTTAMAASLAAFHRHIPVAHVEAGLRTGDMTQPWPEEMNRRLVDAVSNMMFAPTASSRANLLRENLSGKIFITGNTVIDALRLANQHIMQDRQERDRLDAHFPFIDPSRKLLLVTGHRRENFGVGFMHICSALTTLARRSDIQIVYPVHLNPNVQRPVMAALSGFSNVALIAPLDYLHFVRLMQRAHVILTDSGGVQEEAPYLGKPVLVMRDVTERPEAVDAGTVQLVGTEANRIVAAVSNLYDHHDLWNRFSHRENPYGDGYASDRIVAALLGDPFEQFVPAAIQAQEQSLAT
jgi:UDP-N-acetylglucosamine 2-epimerase (non-hydrolysing)